MILRRHDLEIEEKRLAPYGCQSAKSLGREHPQAPDMIRTDFQRDRDRIIHSSAFRKLNQKTQVFGTAFGDYHRTRLTHTMEVAQIARTLAQALGLNQQLTEAIALAHDLGHTPFGHAGEEAMRECMSGHGGFEHNEQGLRIVEYLEDRYPEHPGLNLTYEVREGIVKHDTAYDTPRQNDRYLPGKQPTLESQITDLADEVAYNCADLDDSLQLGFLEEEDLKEAPWVYELFDRARNEVGATAPAKYIRYIAMGWLYERHVMDALENTSANLEQSGVASVEEVREHPQRIAAFSPDFFKQLTQLKDFLLDRVYLSPKTLMNSERGRRFITELFQAYLENPKLMPRKYQKKIAAEGEHRVICDYIAGMTDRYLNEQYRNLFHPEVFR